RALEGPQGQREKRQKGKERRLTCSAPPHLPRRGAVRGRRKQNATTYIAAAAAGGQYAVRYVFRRREPDLPCFHGAAGGAPDKVCRPPQVVRNGLPELLPGGFLLQQLPDAVPGLQMEGAAVHIT